MTEKYVIIGDGEAGATAAEEIASETENAEVTVLTDESEPLYNRIMLKNYMKGTLPKKFTRVHNENWYDDRGLDLHLNTKVEDVDAAEKAVKTSAGEEFSYDKLLVASGGSPRKLPFDNNYENVKYMWTMNDAEHINNSVEESEKAVIIGGGLLGIDLAVAYAENNCDTYYLIRGGNWWRRGLDQEGAEIIHRKLEEKGVKIKTETECTKFEVEDNNVSATVLDSGEKIGCDAVAVAIGQTPNSEIVDVEKNKHEMIKTDKFLETSKKDVYAAGNMVEYESPVFEHRTVNGSWDHSGEMGKCAAHNMMEKQEPFQYVNTYGVGHFDVQFLSIGDFTGQPISKKYNKDEYRRLFFDDNRLVGAVMIGYTKGQEKIKELIQDKKQFENKEKLLEKQFWE